MQRIYKIAIVIDEPKYAIVLLGDPEQMSSFANIGRGPVFVLIFKGGFVCQVR